MERKKASDAQIKASRKWENKNRQRATYLSSRRAARSFINKHANEEDLNELENMISERRKVLENPS